MKDLPVEMIVEIMQYLHPKDIGKMSESNKYINRVVKKNRKTHIYELPNKVLEKIFKYIVNATCLEGFNKTKLEKFIPQLPYKIVTNTLYGYNNYNLANFAMNYNLLRKLDGMKGLYEDRLKMN